MGGEAQVDARPLNVAHSRERAAAGLVCIRDTDAFRSLAAQWQALARRSRATTPFNSWEWLFSWWQAYGVSESLRLLAMRHEGALVGLAPLYLAREPSALGTPCRTLKLVGDGSFDSDYLGFLVEPAHEASFVDAFVAWLHDDREWDALSLREMPAAATLGMALRERAGELGADFRADGGRAAVLELPATFDALLAQLQPRFRTKLRSLLRRIDEHAVTFEYECMPREMRTKLRSLFDLHQRRWTSAGEPGMFGSARKRMFYAHFVPRFARRGWLRLYSLRCDGRYVAHQLCFGEHGTTYLLQEGFDTSNASASYGQMLRAAVIRHLIERRERRYDFLGGFSRHKETWGAVEEPIVHALLARRNPRGFLYFRAPAWRERLGSAARRALPGPLIDAARRAIAHRS
jgi:CelD/BcsL family acetyltransferase involved in cellulose biosynthesis